MTVHLFNTATLLPTSTGSPYELRLADVIFAVADLETSGLSPANSRVIEVAVSRVTAHGVVLSEFETLVNAPGGVGPTNVHRITQEMNAGAPTFSEIAGEIADQFRDAVGVAHNVSFESRFLGAEFSRCVTEPMMVPALCTLKLARATAPAGASNKLSACCSRFGVSLRGAHTAMGDVRATRELLLMFISAALERAPDAVLVPTSATTVPTIVNRLAPYPRSRARTAPQPPRRVVGSTSRPTFTRLPGEF